MELWRHPNVSSTRVDAFRRHVNRKYDLAIKTYADLHQWSVQDIEQFGKEIWIYCGLKYSVPPSSVGIGLELMYPRPQWFPGARLNYTENILAMGLAAQPDSIAVSACREGGTGLRHLTWMQLRSEVERWVSALKRAGIAKGDRVASVLTNSVECLVLLLACGSLGAIFSSTSPDMGAAGIVERYSQLNPKIVFVETQILYAGKDLDLRDRMSEALSKLREKTPSLEQAIVVNGRLFQGEKVATLAAFLEGEILPLEFEQVSFDHPIYVLFSSGTTGPPKCICHAGGGALLQQKKELILTSDIGLTSSYYQYTTTGWMMWNYLVGALSCGSRIFLYDGSPLHPSPAYQIELLQQQGITHWGTSPKFLTALRQFGMTKQHLIRDLQLVMASGSPLNHEIYQWFYEVLPSRVGLFSGSGGTDLVGGIVMGSPLLPIHSGEISSASLGMKVEIWDLGGKNIEHTGEKGDLVITRPFFSMPTTFWGEGGEKKYKKAYFDTFPGVWCHGDFIKRNPKTGGYEILGRSDGVLNPGGVRFGTAELYGVLDRFTEVEDCIAVGQRRTTDQDERVLMFIKLRQGLQLTKTLRLRIQEAIKRALSARHVPAHILQVQDIPYTVNGKKIENVVRDIVSGRDHKVSGTATNPECLAEYAQYFGLDMPQNLAKL